ncbi:hypothetical protein GDO78_012728 [Eleutherodactylus coqui]|uniref:Uncharacterized protein n=1 Tax=Eleutherodactylus coqui TaxID=57060 RepID=A0A8J6EZX7_ELECQ|nr:hypothetical protein GDO78_012728 [Eleutherodactylus coqui]
MMPGVRQGVMQGPLERDKAIGSALSFHLNVHRARWHLEVGSAEPAAAAAVEVLIRGAAFLQPLGIARALSVAQCVSSTHASGGALIQFWFFLTEVS